jgi:6-phosphofructokinase 1
MTIQGRIPGDLGRITRERLILQQHLDEGRDLETDVRIVERQTTYQNTVSENILGIFRPPTERKAVIADMKLIHAFEEKKLKVPSFLEAGPRKILHHDPQKVRAAIVTTGGLAPGLNCVIHNIVKRHCKIYSIDKMRGKVFGVYDGFRGLCSLADNLIELDPNLTEGWLDQGGSKLGNVRYYHNGRRNKEVIPQMVEVITTNLQNIGIDILYVIGGDGSLEVAHAIALANPAISVVGIPKTMDNDILWVWQSFGFNTAVEQAAQVINTLHSEAESTRRIGLIELFGAESGFVAANASLASGHVDLVLIPEVFQLLSKKTMETDQRYEEAVQNYLDEIVNHIGKTLRSELHNPHTIVVVAEGVGSILEKEEVHIDGVKINKDTFAKQLQAIISKRVRDAHGREIEVFINQPRHYIRSASANPHDQIYCERLGALAVDNALAGYTDFMISQWLTEFVLVPLHLVEGHQKGIPVNGMFWKQVVSSTGQPLSAVEQVVT